MPESWKRDAVPTSLLLAAGHGRRTVSANSDLPATGEPLMVSKCLYPMGVLANAPWRGICAAAGVIALTCLLRIVRRDDVEYLPRAGIDTVGHLGSDALDHDG